MARKHTKANRPEAHHYVPQFYLRQWAHQYRKGHTTSAFDRVTDKSYKANVRDVACQNAFNRINLEGEDPNALEKAYGEFETQLAESVSRVNEARSLDNEDDRAALIHLIALTGMRNPTMRSAITQFTEEHAKHIVLAQSKEQFEASFQAAKDQGAVAANAEVSFEELQQALEGGGFKAVRDGNAVALNELQMIEHADLQLLGRKWRLLRAPEGSAGFVTSDRPFQLVWTDPAKRVEGEWPGLAQPGTQVIFPVSPKLALVGSFEQEEGADDVDEARVAEINGLTAFSADRQVYALNHDFSYIADPNEPVRKGGQLIPDKRFPKTQPS